MNLPLRVIKVGGSLFELPDLRQRVHSWIDQQPAARNVLVAGGGALCDVIRQADRQFQLGEVAAHWLCIRALATSAGMLAELLQLDEIDSWDDLRRSTSVTEPMTVVFNVTPFLIADEASQPGRSLPHGWQVTTDSIAARVAELLAADELVLLKSASASEQTLDALAEVGFVDRDFPQAAISIRVVRFVNLRGA